MTEPRQEEAAAPPTSGMTPAPELPPPEETPADVGGKIAQLERVVRSVARDSLALSRGQRDAEAMLQAIRARLEDLELATKGVSQTAWRAVQESAAQIQAAEAHYAGAIRELEARLGSELRWQIYRSAAQAVLPALDDMDLVIGNHAALARKRACGALTLGGPAAGPGDDESLLEAMRMVRRKLVDGLRVLGLEEIPVQEGTARPDPAQHEVIESDIPAEFIDDEGVPPGAIYRVRRAGFTMDGRVFRPARVLVKS